MRNRAECVIFRLANDMYSYNFPLPPLLAHSFYPSFHAYSQTQPPRHQRSSFLQDRSSGQPKASRRTLHRANWHIQPHGRRCELHFRRCQGRRLDYQGCTTIRHRWQYNQESPQRIHAGRGIECHPLLYDYFHIVFCLSRRSTDRRVFFWETKLPITKQDRRVFDLT